LKPKRFHIINLPRACAPFDIICRNVLNRTQFFRSPWRSHSRDRQAAVSVVMPMIVAFTAMDLWITWKKKQNQTPNRTPPSGVGHY
jgi:hypothetical protein